MNENVKILVIYTGGTIGMMEDPLTGSLRPFEFEQLYQHIPVLKSYNYNIDFHVFSELIDSSNVNPLFWKELAEVIEKSYELYDGFVVLHGTDTMSFSASMLSFMLENLNKPVVFTGSQLPMGVIRTDGRDNFINAIEIAAAQSDKTPLVPEVSIVFDNKLFRGNRTSKFNSENFKAFVSGNYPLLAEVGVKIKYQTEHILKPNFKKLIVRSMSNANVGLLKLFPGISEAFVNDIFHSKGLQGLVMETFGSGNTPTDAWFIKAMKNAIDNGLIIYVVTQCKGGSVNIGKYETSTHLATIGAISGYDITTEAAITKMMYLLGNVASKDEIKRLLSVNLRGEMTVETN
jgi:L-asparaginase